MFVTVFIRARHWSLCWPRCIKSTTSHPISLRSIPILSSRSFLVFLVYSSHKCTNIKNRKKWYNTRTVLAIRDIFPVISAYLNSLWTEEILLYGMRSEADIRSYEMRRRNWFTHCHVGNAAWHLLRQQLRFIICFQVTWSGQRFISLWYSLIFSSHC
jgi:hypothetical protein